MEKIDTETQTRPRDLLHNTNNSWEREEVWDKGHSVAHQINLKVRCGIDILQHATISLASQAGTGTYWRQRKKTTKQTKNNNKTQKDKQKPTKKQKNKQTNPNTLGLTNSCQYETELNCIITSMLRTSPWNMFKFPTIPWNMFRQSHYSHKPRNTFLSQQSSMSCFLCKNNTTTYKTKDLIWHFLPS